MENRSTYFMLFRSSIEFVVYVSKIVFYELISVEKYIVEGSQL